MRGLARWRGIRRLFSVYPRGLPGAGLLLLRIGVGAAPVLGLVRVDIVTAVSGVLLVAGFLTPISALSMTAVLAVSLYRSTSGALELSTIMLTGACVAQTLVGPGAWSVDARLFGRREIAIPRRP